MFKLAFQNPPTLNTTLMAETSFSTSSENLSENPLISLENPISENPISEIPVPVIAPEVAVDGAAETSDKPSYVKLAMRNMVKKKALSLFHFSLTTVALLSFLIGLAYLTR